MKILNTVRKVNLPLILGLAIVLGILFIVLFGSYYAPHNPKSGNPSIYTTDANGERVLLTAPFPPSKEHPFGTDKLGRDLLSVLMAGAKNTFKIVLLATLFRFIVAIPMAFLAAFGEKISKRLIIIFSSAFTAVPSLILSIMILKLYAIRKLDVGPSIVAFVIVFTIVGWGRLASTIEEKIKDILNEDFIKGEIAIGKSKFAIATQNVLVHLTPSIVIYVFLEIALVLLLLAQLGVFKVFVGNKQVAGSVDSFIPGATRTYYNFFPEWGGMMVDLQLVLSKSRLWISGFPTLAFSISILGFNLLGQGLNLELNKRSSKFISNINKLSFHLSPKTYINEVMNFNKKRKSVIVKTSSVFIIVLLIVLPMVMGSSITEKDLMEHIIEFQSSEYQGRLIGTSGHDSAGNYIISKLKEANFKPLFNGEYTSEFAVEPFRNFINTSNLHIKDASGNILEELKYPSAYYFKTWPTTSTETLQGEILTYQKYIAEEFDPSKDYFLVLRAKKEELLLYTDIIKTVRGDSPIKGIILSDINDTRTVTSKINLTKNGLVEIMDEDPYYSEGSPPITIHTSVAVTTRIADFAGNILTVSSQTQHPDGLVGKNIGGIIEGKDQDHPIIVTATYDYLGFHDVSKVNDVTDIIEYKGLYENGTAISGMLELAERLGNINQTPDKSIIFIFIDASSISNEGFKHMGTLSFFDQTPLLLHLKYMGIIKWNRPQDNFYYATIFDHSDSKQEQEFLLWLRRHGSNNKSHILLDKGIRSDSLMKLINSNMTAMVFQGLDSYDVQWHDNMEQSSTDGIDMIRLRNHFQYLLDSIVDMAYGHVMFY